MAIRERFWAKVDVRGPNECWLWEANKNKQGYGRFWDGHRKRRSHRVAYNLCFGPIPDGMLVCHRCDNPSCVNPAHLFLGTHADNMADAAEKGRLFHGEQHYRAKLTAEDVQCIKQLFGEGMDQKEIGRQHGVHRSTIGAILSGRTWKHIM